MKSLKKYCSLLLCMSVGITFGVGAVSVSADTSETIVSPYSLRLTSPTKVVSNRTYSDVNWDSQYMTPSSTGAYNGGKYLTLRGSGGYVSVTLDNLTDGLYDVYYYVPGGTLAASNFSTNYSINIAGYENYSASGLNQSTHTYGSFNLIKSGIVIKNGIQIKFTSNSDPNLRIDAIKLLLKAPITVDSTRIDNIKFEGQTVAANGIEGLAVGGKANVSYTFKSDENLAEDTSAVQYQWYSSLLSDGDYTPITSATGNTYTVTSDDAGRFIKVGIKTKTTSGVQIKETFSNPMEVKYKLTFVDEFDYTAVNGEDANFLNAGWKSDKAIRILGTPTIYSARVPENVSVSNGTMKIVTRKEHLSKYDSLTNGTLHTWTTGNVITSKVYGPYGVYDCSYKFAKATGLNQSFWAMTSGKSSAANGFCELDFDEGHYPREMSTNVHRMVDTTNADGTVTSTRLTNAISYYPLGNTSTSPTFADNFNRFTGMLKPNNPSYAWDSTQNSDTYQVFNNNVNLRKTKSLQYQPAGLQIFCSIAVYPGTFTGQLVDSEADGSVMEVDYVRFYEFLDATKTDIQRKIAEAQRLLNSAVVGTANGNYTQLSINALNAKITEANNVLTSTTLTVEQINTTVSSLDNAITAFKNSIIGGYYVSVTGVSFDNSSYNVTIGYTKQLNPTVAPSDASNKAVTFTTSNSSVVAVSQDGLVTAVSVGQATITATTVDGSKKAQCIIIASPLPTGYVFCDVSGGKLVFDTVNQMVTGYVGSIDNITIPNTINGIAVNSIKTSAFAGCKTLTSVVLENGISQLGEWVFKDCINLKNVTLPNSIISINDGAFMGCLGLTEIIIPASVDKICVDAFNGCTNLKKAIFEGNAPTSVASNVFSGTPQDFYIQFYVGMADFTQPTWYGYKTVAVQREELITATVTNQTDKYSFDINLATGFPVNSTVIVAMYDNNGKLINVKTEVAQANLNISINKTGNEKTAVIMLWDNTSSMMPMSKCKKIDL